MTAPASLNRTMAVCSAVLNGQDFFINLGMLIIQGRKWDPFRRVRGRGLHCPTVRNLSPPHHQCSSCNIECQRALTFYDAIESILRCSSMVIIDVILLPECGHSHPTLLLERWTLRSTDKPSRIPELSLMQAIDSTIHFSQLCSWWSSTNGAHPKNIDYKLHGCNGGVKALNFSSFPLDHQFMVSGGVEVHLASLPRQQIVPELRCENCCTASYADASVLQNQGRTFKHQQSGSCHSSASSNSLSQSVVSNINDRTSLGSTLLSFCVTLSSSPSSRGSSPASSPCTSTSPSRRNSLTTLKLTESMAFESNSPVKDINIAKALQNCENESIDQDEELANQLDSLSDSDLSDDYVIDGPIGSPRLAGTPVASSDDSRVQMLQSTFAGFHCRHPTFDRLMGDSLSNSGRTRHSSLDSAVSNLERLNLKFHRRLSRTSSDGQNYQRQLDSCDEKMSRKMSFSKDQNGLGKLYKYNESIISSHCLLHSYSSFNSSFCVDQKLMCVGSDPSQFYDSADEIDNFKLHLRESNKLQLPIHTNPFIRYVPPSFDCQSSSSTLFLHTPFSEQVDKEIPCLKQPSCNSSSELVKLFNFDPNTLSLDETPTSLNATPTDRTIKSGIMQSETSPCVSRNSHHSRVYNLNVLPIATSRKLNVRRILRSHEDGNITVTSETMQNSKYNSTSISKLLQSPPSKLRILPSHCVEKNYENNSPRESFHKIASSGSALQAARKLRFKSPSKSSVCTSPAPIRRNNSVRFEFDEDMPNQRSSRSSCRGKCMQQNGIIVPSHNHVMSNQRLLGSFEESIIHNRLEVLGSVDGFHAQLGASGFFCPQKVKLPVDVRFYHVSEDNAPSPYMGVLSLKGKECSKRGYHIPRKGTIQLTLFNPNNSVVRVFVILYDVSEMPPGHQTFIRHRIYSKAVDENDSSVQIPELPDKSSSNVYQPNSKFLRYFVHLWLESSKTNKIYIHGDVKILFSLASKEWDSGKSYELLTETEFPKNPRYSTKR